MMVMTTMKKIAVMGSTGSIGLSTLKVIQANPDKYKVVTLAAGRKIDLLAEQVKRFRPAAVAILNEKLASRLKGILPTGACPPVFFGSEGFVEVATMEQIDTVVSAISGAAGLLPTYEAIRAGKNVALANKETLVMAGAVVMAEAEKQRIQILPVDSEHSAILQSLRGHAREDVRRVILTASGGPFRGLSLEEMRNVTPAQALKHPNWNMGPKISIDSATMMNKGLEVIEAKWLYNLDIDQISIFIHPQSIVHSMVEYVDGSVIAQLGIPDMTIPISYALSYPRHVGNTLVPLDLDRIGTLSFEKPDLERFVCLKLAHEAARAGMSMPAVLNGANEIAVECFLKGKIGFLDIPVIIEKTMWAHEPFAVENIDAVIEADRWARKTARSLVNKI